MDENSAKKRILFICTRNSARSQIAEGLVNALFDNRYEAYSAGTEPGSVNSFALQAMSEIGIDITDHTSKHVNEFIDQDFDYVITVCDNANENCPFFPGGKKRIHKSFKDPATEKGDDNAKITAFRNTRDEIRKWLVESLTDFKN